MAGEPFAPGIVALVTLDGSARRVADGLAFPNGMHLGPDSTLDTLELDRGCFACALRSPDRKTLLIVANEWHGPEAMFAEPPTGQVVATEAPAPAAGWP